GEGKSDNEAGGGGGGMAGATGGGSGGARPKGQGQERRRDGGGGRSGGRDGWRGGWWHGRCVGVGAETATGWGGGVCVVGELGGPPWAVRGVVAARRWGWVALVADRGGVDRGGVGRGGSSPGCRDGGMAVGWPSVAHYGPFVVWGCNFCLFYKGSLTVDNFVQDGVIWHGLVLVRFGIIQNKDSGSVGYGGVAVGVAVRGGEGEVVRVVVADREAYRGPSVVWWRLNGGGGWP
nr:hypothetical protein [Tanacetum cinerariifolium]